MTKHREYKEEWIPCPHGTLTILARDKRTNQRRQFLLRTGSAAGAIAVATGLGWLALRKDGPSADPVYAGIACSRVRALAPQMKMGELDADLSDQIMAHLKQCDKCRELVESMHPKSSDTSPLHRGNVAACRCSGCRRDHLSALLTKNESKVPAAETA